MPSLYHRRIAINIRLFVMLLLLLTTRCCHGLQSFRPSKIIIGRTSNHHHHVIRSVTSSSICQGIFPATALSLSLNNCNSPQCYLHGGRRISKSPYYRASLTKLYSQTNNSSPRNNSKDDDKDAISTHETETAAASSFLKQHLAQLEYDGKLQSKEAASINDSLLNLLHEEETTTTTAAAFQNRNQINNNNMASSSVSNITQIFQTSIELFLTQTKSRQRLNSQRPIIENAGGYVRMIVRNQLSKKMMMSGSGGTTDDGGGSGQQYRLDVVKEQQQQQGSNHQFVDDTIQQQQRQEQVEGRQTQQQAKQPQHDSTNNDNTNIQTILQSFLHSNQIQPNELNDSCLETLNQTSPNMVQYALEAYVHQKERRLRKGMTPILDPSSYVLKILR